MKKFYLLCFLSAITSFAFGQIQQVPVTLVDDIHMSAPIPPGGSAKFSNSTVSCSEDTLQYGAGKASGYNALSVSDGYALCQYYDAPDTVTISGASFYAWNLTGEDTSILLTVAIYNVGSDSLPTGNPIRTKDIAVDTSFGGGLLSVLRKSIAFDSSFTTTDPYIIAISSVDTLRCGVVSNNFNNNDGEAENIAGGTVGGTWYRCLNLNVGGTTLDCDMILEPHVTYNIYSDFSVANCYDPNDSLVVQNQSSPFLNNRMYNRYFFYNIGRFSHRWNFGDNFNNYYEYQPKYLYNTPGNYTVRLITTIYGWRVNASCYDTSFYNTSYLPSAIGYTVDTPICSGNDAVIDVYSTAAIFWYNSPNDTSSFYIGQNYVDTGLTSDKTYYVSAQNGDCRTPRTPILVPVATTPNDPITLGDSICLNAQGNVSASSNAGMIVWYDSASGGNIIDTGNVLVTTPLTSSKTFYALAVNRGCESPNRIAATINVSASNAPPEPLTNLDSLVCLHDGSFTLNAIPLPGDSIFWYDVPAGGSPISTGNYYTYEPASLGNKFVYVEANDGSCASTRLQKKLTVWTFPQKEIPSGDTLCQGDIAIVDFSSTFGSVRWYDDSTAGNLLYDSNYTVVSGLTNTTTFFLEPFSQTCVDTMRHSLTFDVLEIGLLSNISGDQICANNISNLGANTTAGEIVWSENENMMPVYSVGSPASTPILTENKKYYVQSRNAECLGKVDSVTVIVDPAPNSNYNFQVNNPGDFNFIANENGLTYAWDFGDGKTATTRSSNHLYETNDTFTVTLTTTGSNGCTSTTTKTVIVNGLTGTISVNELDALKFIVYPNPADNRIYVELMVPSSFSLTNSLGQIDMIGNLASGLNQIDTEALSPGIYHLAVKQDEHIEFRRIVIH